MKTSRLLTMSLFAFIFSSGAMAFTLNSSGGGLQGWTAQTVVFDYNFSGCSSTLSTDTLVGILDSALNVWNDISTSSIKLVRGSPVTATTAAAISNTQAGNPLVLCDSNFAANFGNPDLIPAVTTLLTSSSRVAYSAIFLNSQSGKAASIDRIGATILTIVLSHEIGHAIGLGHSSYSSALMYYDLTARTQATLAQDDRDGAAYLYPRNEFFGNSNMACGNISSSGGMKSKHSSSQQKGGSSAAAEMGILLLICFLLSRNLKRGSSFELPPT